MAVLARLAHRAGFSPIPLYVLAGLAFGEGGLLPLDISASFVGVGAEIGVLLLLLFMLGLEYTGDELCDRVVGRHAHRRGPTGPLACRGGAGRPREFSIVIAGLGVGLDPRLRPLAAAYVLFLAVLGPVLALAVEPLYDRAAAFRTTRARQQR